MFLATFNNSDQPDFFGSSMLFYHQQLGIPSLRGFVQGKKLGLQPASLKDRVSGGEEMIKESTRKRA